MKHDQAEIQALYKEELVGLEWSRLIPEVLEVFVQPAQAHKVYDRQAPHPGVLFAAFDRETVDVFARWGALLRYGGIALLANAGFVGMVIWRWTRPTGALASCLLCLILWGRVFNPAVVQAGYVTNLRRKVFEMQSSVDDLVVVLSERQRCLKSDRSRSASDDGARKQYFRLGSRSLCVNAGDG